MFNITRTHTKKGAKNKRQNMNNAIIWARRQHCRLGTCVCDGPQHSIADTESSIIASIVDLANACVQWTCVSTVDPWLDSALSHYYRRRQQRLLFEALMAEVQEAVAAKEINQSTLVRLLSQYYVHIDAKVECTLAACAVMDGWLFALQWLLDCGICLTAGIGIKRNRQWRHWSLCTISCLTLQPQIVQMLMHAGACPEEASASHFSFLYQCGEHQSLVVRQLLMSYWQRWHSKQNHAKQLWITKVATAVAPRKGGQN